MRRSRAPYWDIISGRIPRRRFFSDKPMVPCSFLGPVKIPTPGEKKAEKEDQKEPSFQEQAEAKFRAEKKAVQEKAFREMPDYDAVKAELDEEFARKKSEADVAGEMSKKLKAPNDHKMTYDKRFKEK